MYYLGSPENHRSSPTRLSSCGYSRARVRGGLLSSNAISLGMSGTSSGTVKQGKAGSSIRDQAIEKYLALIKHKRELQRKNQKIQTKIAQHLRKNKVELGEFTMVSQPIRLILVDWLYPKDFLISVRLFQVRFFKFFLWNPKIICMAPQFYLFF